MTPVPLELDGARVLEWAWSDDAFGEVQSLSGELAKLIHGLAICQYNTDHQVYRFSCNNNWEVCQDQIYDSAQEAKDHLPEQYRRVPALWNSNP
jgi:hypothetical protein